MADLNVADVEIVLSRAYQMAANLQHEYLTLEHVLRSLLEEDELIDLIEDMDVDPNSLREYLDEYLQSDALSIIDDKPKGTVTLERIKKRAMYSCIFTGRHDLHAYDLLLALFPEEKSYAVTILHAHNITYNKVVRWLFGEDAMPQQVTSQKPKSSPIDIYCVNLNERAKSGLIDPLIGRTAEVDTILQIMSRRRKNNVMLVGDSGTGKTAIPEGLAWRIVQNQVPSLHKDSVVYSLDLAALVAGAKYKGEFEERIKMVLAILSSQPNSILFIDEIHGICTAGNGEGSAGGMSNILKPYLARGELRCIGSTTYEEYRKYIEKDKALSRRFTRIDITEPSIPECIDILHGIKSKYQEFHGVSYTDDAIISAVELSARYITDRRLPDKAIDLLDAAGASYRNRDGAASIITATQIEHEVSKVARIPPQTVHECDKDRLLRLETDLNEDIFGQEEAVSTLVDAVYTSRAGLRPSDKTQGCYLFVGPTGTGKTAVAIKLASVLGIGYVRFDMSEYQEKHSISTLIGSRPGYVGYDDGAAGSGVLAAEIDKHPHCVLLLDEIEKAHPDVHNILLQVMDTGFLTTATGKKVDFRNVFIIMTSNAGAVDMDRAGIGFVLDDRSYIGDKALADTFMPEFRNRIDSIVRFVPHTPETMHRIVGKFISELNDALREKNVTIQMSDAATEWLAKKGFDPKMGARPMHRAIHTYIKSPLSRRLLFGDLSAGGVVMVELNEAGDIELR